MDIVEKDSRPTFFEDDKAYQLYARIYKECCSRGKNMKFNGLPPKSFPCIGVIQIIEESDIKYFGYSFTYLEEAEEYFKEL